MKRPLNQEFVKTSLPTESFVLQVTFQNGLGKVWDKVVFTYQGISFAKK